jgi:acyltransferase
MNRIKEFDTIKAIAIFIVVYCHNDFSSEINRYFHTFVLSLFFIISGYLNNASTATTFRDFLQKKAKRLLIPYLFFSSCLFVFWFFVTRHFGDSSVVDYSPFKNLLGIFYAQGGNEFMNWGIPLWFLPAMYLTLMIDFCVDKTTRNLTIKIVIAAVILIVGYLLNQSLQFRLPWSIDVAIICYSFLLIGKMLKQYSVIEQLSSKKFRYLIGIIFFLINILTYQYNGRIDYYYGMFGKSIIFMIFNGLIAFFWIFIAITYIPSIKAITWIGQNTLPILALHLSAMSFLKAISIYIFKTQIILNTTNSFIFAIIQLIILIPIILVINRYLPFLSGIDSKKRC